MTYVEDAAEYSFIPADELKGLKSTAALFEKGPNQSIIILKHQERWTTFEGLTFLADLTTTIEKLEDAESCTAITSIQLPEKKTFGIQKRPVINLGNRTKFKPWKDTFSRYTDITSKFISHNEKFALIYYQNDSIPTAIKTGLASLQGEFGLEASYFFETTGYNTELKSNATQNLILTGILSLILISISFFIFTRSLNGLVLIVLLILFNLAIVIVIMAITKVSIGPHLTAIPSIIAVMSFSDIMHILYHYKKVRKTISEEKKLRSKLRKDLFFPLFLTSLTNTIGFILYLIVSDNIYLTDLGFISISGVGVAYLSAKLFAIQLIRPRSIYINDRVMNRIEVAYQNCFDKIVPHRLKIIVGFAVLTVGLAIFVSQTIKTESTSSAFISADSNMALGQEILAQHFFGNQSITISIRDQRKSPLYTPTTLSMIQSIEDSLIKISQPLYVSGPLNVIKRYNRFRVSGHSAAYRIPSVFTSEMEIEFGRIARELGWMAVVDSSNSFGEMQIGFYNNDQTERLELYRKIQQIIPHDASKPLQFSLSGKSYLNDRAEETFINWVLFGFLLTFFFTGVLMIFILKSIRKTVVFVLVNALPLCFALFLMGIFNVPINTVSIFMLSILVGLCLDDSIYLVTLGFKEKNVSGIYPIIVTTVVLAIGILSLSVSSYDWIKPFAFIFFSSFLVSLFADIIILPLLLKPTKRSLKE